MFGDRNAPSLLHLLPIILLGGLIMGWPAYLNGYPLVFVDTGNHIGQVNLHCIGWTAPPFHSAFLAATDLGLTLWRPMLAQGLIAATVVVIALDQFDLRRRWGMPAAFVALAGFTSLPWLASQVTADFCTGIAVLSLALLAFGTLAPCHRRVLLPEALLAHQSHVPLALGLSLAAAAIGWAQGGRRAAWAILAADRTGAGPGACHRLRGTIAHDPLGVLGVLAANGGEEPLCRAVGLGAGPHATPGSGGAAAGGAARTGGQPGDARRLSARDPDLRHGGGSYRPA